MDDIETVDTADIIEIEVNDHGFCIPAAGLVCIPAGMTYEELRAWLIKGSV